jgi:P pilus assembly chaperone PapD
VKFYLTLILVYLNTLAYAQGISVSPSRIFFKGEAGQTVSQVISFSNASTSEFYFVANIKDWDRDSLGVKQYYPMGQREQSNGSWLSLSDNTVALAPGETKSVNLSITIPTNSKPQELTNSMLFFTQVKEQKDHLQHGVNMNILLEIGIQVYHTPNGMMPGDLEFLAFEDKGMSIKEADQQVRKMLVKIKNTGQINKDAYVRFELTNIESGEEIPVKSIAVAMLPHAEQWIELNLPATLKGRYLAVAILDAGTQYDLKIAEKEITY